MLILVFLIAILCADFAPYLSLGIYAGVPLLYFIGITFVRRATRVARTRLHLTQRGPIGSSKGSAPHVLAVLNSCVLALFDLFQIPNVKQQMRFLAAHPLQAVRLLLTSLEEHEMVLQTADGMKRI